MCTSLVQLGTGLISVCRWMQKIKRLTNGSLCDSVFPLLFTHFRALSLVSGTTPVALWCCIDEPIFKTHLRRAHSTLSCAIVHQLSYKPSAPTGGNSGEGGTSGTSGATGSADTVIAGCVLYRSTRRSFRISNVSRVSRSARLNRAISFCTLLTCCAVMFVLMFRARWRGCVDSSRASVARALFSSLYLEKSMSARGSLASTCARNGRSGLNPP
jgi:hypothetical protein